MKYYLTTILLTLSTIIFSQNKEYYYFDSEWNSVDSKTNSSYYRVIEYLDNGQPKMPVKDYWSDGKLQSEFYSDKVNITGLKYKGNIKEMGMNNGKSVFFNKNGDNKIDEYLNGKLISSLDINELKPIDLTDKFDEFIIKENLTIRNKFISKITKELVNSSDKLTQKNPEIKDLYPQVIKKMKKDKELSSKVIVYPFQKHPEKIVNIFFNSFKTNDYSKFNSFIDPYGKTDRDTQQLILMMYYIEPILPKDMKRLPDMFKKMNLKVVDSTTNKNIASVKISVQMKDKKVDGIVSLINRHGYWFLKNSGI
ncbi:hypothetical protein LNI96_11560 [Tenacibaculum dicentrarchi]|nr:hypothetical protein [Tenacibaculum dicentrarchi]